MAKTPINTITSLANNTSSLATLNANFQALSDSVDETLSRLGESPNEMESDLDMNNNRILNLPAATTGTEPVRLNEFNEIVADIAEASNTLASVVAAGDAATASAAAAAASAVAADASADAAAVSEANAESWANLSQAVTVSATAPEEGNLWYDTNSGNIYVYYDDGSSTQWVPIAVSYPAHAHAGEDLTSGTINISRMPTTGFSAAWLTTGTLPDARLRAKYNFRAHKNGTDQSGVVTGTPTKVTFTTEEWDVGGYYDAANSRFTPPAGKYVLAISVNQEITNMVDAARIQASIYKNGSLYAGLPETVSGTAVVQGTNGTYIVDANGTDYFEVYATFTGSSDKTIDGNSGYTFFSGWEI